MRITVADMLGWPAVGMTNAEIISAPNSPRKTSVPLLSDLFPDSNRFESLVSTNRTFASSMTVLIAILCCSSG